MAPRKKLDPRKMMELAISVMRKSISEPRDDGKASPLVGAVLVKTSGHACKIAVFASFNLHRSGLTEKQNQPRRQISRRGCAIFGECV